MAETLKGLTITVGADTKQFNKEMRAVDREISATNRQVNELQRSLKLEFNNERFIQAQQLAQKALTDTGAKVESLRGQLKHLDETGADKASASYLRLQTELVRTEARAVTLKKKLEDINDIKIEHLAKQFEKVGEGISKAGKALTPISALAAGAAAGLTAAGKSAVTTAAELDTLSQRVNLSAEDLQRWQYIAMQTGVSTSDLQTGLARTQLAFGNLAKGDINGTAQALLNLGFTADEASKGMSANFDRLISTLGSIEDPILQAAYAHEVLGRNLGGRVIPLLKSGGEGLKELSKEFEQFNYMTNQQVQDLADFDNEMNKLKYSLQTIKDQLGVAMLPIMQSLAALMEERVVPAFRKLTEWFTSLSEKQRNMVVGTLAVVAALAPVLLIVGKLTSGIGGLIKSIGGISKALSVLTAHPIIAIITAIAALLIYLYATNEQFRESINNLVKTLGGALMPLLETIGDAFKQLLSAINPIIQVIGEVLVPIIDILTTVLEPLINIISTIFITKIGAAMPFIMALINLISFLANIIKSVLVPALEFMGKVYDAIFAKMRSAMEGTVKYMEKAVNKMIDLINWTIRQINKLGKFIGFTLDELDHVEIKVAEGKTPEASKEDKPPSATDVIGETPIQGLPNVITNNDYSNKDININVTVENFAENVDVDDMVRQINIKLAEQM